MSVSVEETEQVGQRAASCRSQRFCRPQTRREIDLRICGGWHWCRGGFVIHGRGGGWSLSLVWIAAVAAVVRVTTTTDDTVTTSLQSFLGLSANTSVAIDEGSLQGRHNFLAAAAAAGILNELVADFISGFFADVFVGIVEGVDHGDHDLRIANAIVVVTQFVDRRIPISSIAGCLRFVDQLCNHAWIGIAALRFAATCFLAAALFRTAGRLGCIALGGRLTALRGGCTTSGFAARLVFCGDLPLVRVNFDVTRSGNGLFATFWLT